MKRGQIIGTFIFMLLISMTFVSAGVDSNIKKAIDGFTNSESVKTILTYVLGGAGNDAMTDFTGDLLFVKLLIFILLLGMVYFAAGKVPTVGENKVLQWLVAIIVSLLGIRFLTSEALINFVWLPNGVLGVAFATLFPFVLVFFFLESFTSEIIRKIGWSTVIVLYIGLAVYRWQDLAGPYWNLGWIYVFIAILSLLVILLDKTIRSKLLFWTIEKKGQELNALNIATLQTQIENARSTIASSTSTSAQVTAAQNIINDAKRKIKALIKS